MILARTLDYFDYLDIYVQNKHVKDIHPIATLISDATLTYFKDPVKAFNYLSTIETEDLEPEIMNIMDKNISIYSKNRDLKNELIYKLIPLLQKRYNLELKCIKLTHYDYARFLNLLK
ncbi:MAG: hypothetical protein KKF52_00605 [Nanoarchaeota archaeon]|nr:hypothetical protein [Nanoarchaeota archaeon]MBU4352113.1 hypothetical protein [Nanoarchaeota archaeon]